MLIIDTFESRGAAEAARTNYVSAQSVVDGVMEQIAGQPVYPIAEDVYVIVPDGSRYLLALDDPSLPETEDCGD